MILKDIKKKNINLEKIIIIFELYISDIKYLLYKYIIYSIKYSQM